MLHIEQQEFIIQELEQTLLEKEQLLEYCEAENEFLMKKTTEGSDLINKLNAKLANLQQVVRIQDEQI